MITAKNKTQAALAGNVPPHSVEAEQAVLGAALLDPAALPEMLDIVAAEDFYLPSHRAIFKACMSLYDDDAPVDAIAVRGVLKREKLLDEAGGAPYLAALIETTAITARADYHAGIVRDKAQLRRLINACAGIVSKGFEPGATAEEVIAEAENQVREIIDLFGERLNREPSSLEAQFARYLQGLAAGRASRPLSSPWDEINRVLKGGILPGEYAVLAARPSTGKSTVALNWVWSAVCSGKKTVVFSQEMTYRQLFNRLMANVANIDASSFRMGLKPSQIKEIENLRGVVISKPLVLNDTPRMTMGKMRRFLKREAKNGKIDLVVIDYLQLLVPDRREQNREREVAEMSRGVKLLAKEFDAPVLLLAQLNRKAEESRREPIMSDLRESGSIEQDADIIMFLHSPKINGGQSNEIKVIVAKGRDSGTGAAYLRFNRENQRLEGATDLVYRRQMQELQQCGVPEGDELS